ncbi:MAG: NUDIX hydrolase [Myxococcales bacterium]|nr:NUDIX hydrolase [Myxococcales bacterium]
MGRSNNDSQGRDISAPSPAEQIDHDLDQYPRPAVAVDIVILTILDADLKVLLVQRENSPFKGSWALPGGFVRLGNGADDQGEDLDAAAVRELAEETGLSPGKVFLEQMHAFGKSGRDPRMRVISVAYCALVRPDLAPFVEAGGDAADARWFSLSELDLSTLAFDHKDILEYALKHIRARIEDSDIVFELVPGTFSIAELRSVFEVILGDPQDPGNFRRRFLRMVERGLIEQAPGKRVTATRPAKVYRFVREAA